MADATAPELPGNVYTEAQHFSLLRSAVDAETASLTTVKSELETQVERLESEKAAQATELSEAQTRIDLLEADKSNAEKAAEDAKTELAEFKAEIERSAQIAALKSDRRTKVQAANANLGEDFFSEERVTRWAEMSEEAFDAFISDMTEMAKATPKSDDDADDKDKDKNLPDFLKKKKEKSEESRETAAFTGGQTPKSDDAGGVSPLRQFLGAARGTAASA